MSGKLNLMGKTLFDKIWECHIVKEIEEGPSVLYIDRHYIHEVTSPQAFRSLEEKNIPVFRPHQVWATADHNIPTQDQHLPIKDTLSAQQVQLLTENCRKHNIKLMGIGHPFNGIVHVIGPELGITQPGMTIVCGDSHTSTHGAFGCLAFGIGTSEVEMVLATQCLLQHRPKIMRIQIDGQLQPGVLSKDIILYLIARLSTNGATGYFIEFAGDTIRNLSMEARMTICNMSIEMGARGGLIAPDETTFTYLRNREFLSDEEWEKQLPIWKTLYSDPAASFDKEIRINAADISPMITYGTNPGMGVGIGDKIPLLKDVEASAQKDYRHALAYMGLNEGQAMNGLHIDYVFIGSCTNARIEDLRIVADFIKGKKKSEHVTAWIVPGSKQVAEQAEQEGIGTILRDAGFQLRQPGCSACLAMNEDKIPEGKYCVSTSNRNFEGRQGINARTILASPLTAAAAAITGHICDARMLL